MGVRAFWMSGSFGTDESMRELVKNVEQKNPSESGIHIFSDRLEIGYHEGEIIRVIEKDKIEYITKSDNPLGFAVEIIIGEDERIVFYPSAGIGDFLSSTRNRENTEALMKKLGENGYLIK